MTTVEDAFRLIEDLVAVLTRIEAKLGNDAAPRDHEPTSDATTDAAFLRQLATALRTRRPDQASLFLADLTGQQLAARLTSIADRLVAQADQPHYTHVKTLTVPPDHVTPVHGRSGEIMAYKVRVRT